MSKLYSFFFEDGKTDTSFLGMVFLFFSQVWLLILLPYLSPMASEDHILGYFGFYLADALIRTLFGLSAFLLPISFLWLGIFFLLKGKNFSHTVQQFVSFSVLFFTINILLLNSSLIHSSWAGLFPLFFYSLLVHYFPVEDPLSYEMNWRGTMLLIFIAISFFVFFVFSLRIRLVTAKEMLARSEAFFVVFKKKLLEILRVVGKALTFVGDKIKSSFLGKMAKYFFVGPTPKEEKNQAKTSARFGFFFKNNASGEKNGENNGESNCEEKKSFFNRYFFNGVKENGAKEKFKIIQKVREDVLQQELGYELGSGNGVAMRLVTPEEMERLENRLFPSYKSAEKATEKAMNDGVKLEGDSVNSAENSFANNFTEENSFNKNEVGGSGVNNGTNNGVNDLNWNALFGGAANDKEAGIERVSEIVSSEDNNNNKNALPPEATVIDLTTSGLFMKGKEGAAKEVPTWANKDYFEKEVSGSHLAAANSFAAMEENSAEGVLDKNNDATSGVLLGGPAAINRNLPLVARRQICTASEGCLRPSIGGDGNIWSNEKNNTAKGGNEEIVLMGEKLVETLREFGIATKIEGIASGPVLRQYQISIEPGVRVQRVVTLADNLALALAAPSLRIVAPIPGKSLIGIEVPKTHRQTVLLSAMLNKDALAKRDFRAKFFSNLHTLSNKERQKNLFPSQLPIAFGVSILGEMQTFDLAKTPHLLIAGATGSGKSVCVNSIITSLLLAISPNELRLLMIDPKMVELNVYNGIPHLLHPVISRAKDASKALDWVLGEMENRYKLLERCGVRNIVSYNEMLSHSQSEDPRKNSMPYIVVIIDELADLMMTARKEVEDSLCRLAAMSRAVGIHLILATQRPSVDVITGLIKSNFPSRIAFQVSSKIDSRTIIDGSGAEKLLGKGDMLIQSTEHTLQRLQGAFLSEDEVKKVVADLIEKSAGEQDLMKDILGKDETQEGSVHGDDDMFSQALEIAVREQKVSASYLQRRLKIGYNRAARLVEEMEDRGYIGPADGAKPREVFISSL